MWINLYNKEKNCARESHRSVVPSPSSKLCPGLFYRMRLVVEET